MYLKHAEARGGGRRIRVDDRLVVGAVGLAPRGLKDDSAGEAADLQGGRTG